MTENKRFKCRMGRFYDGETNINNILTDTDVLDLLNQFFEENEQLRCKINVFEESITTANTLNEKIDELESELSEKDIELDFLQSENKDFRAKWEYHERMHEQYKKDYFAYLQDLEVFKEENTRLKRQCGMQQEEIECLTDENNRLIKVTSEIVAEHTKKVFDLIDEKIHLLNNAHMKNESRILTDLKKELQGE